MYCKYCGATIENDAIFCPSCGKPQKNINSPQPQMSSQPQPSAKPPIQSNPTTDTSPMVKVVRVVRPPASVSFSKAIALYYKNYANFSGRAVRSEFWWICLYQIIITIGFSFFTIFLFLAGDNGETATSFSVLWSLGHLCPGIALVIRRLHDTGRSGLWWFICLIPLIGALILLIFECEDSGKDNEWGRSPYYYYRH